MTIKLRFTLPILVAFLLVGLSTPVSAAKRVKVESPTIISITHDYDAGVLTIVGNNLAQTGTEPTVLLDGAELTVGPYAEGEVTATTPGDFPVPGDYELLYDSNLDGTDPVRMSLTLGAVGPKGADGADGAQGVQGPQGPVGPGANDGELCALYQLTAQPFPSLCFDCGNGTTEPLEQCDDGNTDVGDGCSAVCESEVCGDDKLDAGEECDDGNTVNGDGCSAVCLWDCSNPIIYSVQPPSVSLASSSVYLSILGEGFSSPELTVFIGGLPYIAHGVIDTEIEIYIETYNLGAGVYDVTVATLGGGCEDTMVNAFEITVP